MTYRTFFRSLGSMSAAVVLAAAVLAGCSDSSLDPTSSTDNNMGSTLYSASDQVPESEAAQVRSNAQKNENDSLALEPKDAADAAEKEMPGCEILGVNLDNDRDSVNYEVIVRSGTTVYLIVIDPQTGKTIKKEEIKNHSYTRTIIITRVKVKVKEAKSKAKNVVNGTVVECNLEDVDGQPTYIIIILTRDNRYVTLHIDGETGEPKQKKDDCGEGDKHKNKRGRGHYRHGNGKGYGHRYHCHCECDPKDTTGGGQDSTDTDSLKVQIISADSARSIALGTFDSVTVTSTKLNVVNDTTANYELKLASQTDSATYDLKLDARTGSFISVKQTGGDLDSNEFTPKVQGDSLVTLSVARTAAIAAQAGTIQSWMLEYNPTETKWVYTFEIKTAANENKKVLIDAKTGTLIRVE